MREGVRVLFVSDHLGYAAGVIHGASTYFFNVLPVLNEAVDQLHVCFLRERHEAASRLESAGVAPHFLSRAKWDPRALLDLVSIVRKNKIQIIHAAGMKGILLGRLAAKMTGARCVAHIHDTNPLGLMTRSLQRNTAAWTDACLVISQAVADYAVETLGVRRERIKVLFNPLPRKGNENPASRASLRQAMGLKDDQFLIAMVGRLAPEKGHALFLRAMKDWLFANAKTHLLIVGDGPQRDALHSLVNSLGLTGEVTFTGQRDNVSELMHMSDVVVVPSLREGLGYVALEAMAAGCPVVAFAVGGLPEIVEHETSGLLVGGGDYPALIEAIDRIRTEHDVTMRLIEGGIRQADFFTADHHVKELIELYRSLVDKS